MMITSFYTSRVVLQALGVEDFGIYNVVGGVVAMLGFLNNSLSTASSRFITVELGKGDANRMKETFASVFQVNCMFALVVLFLSETVGLWFLNTKMTIPQDRVMASCWVYQISILTILLNIVSVPYNAAIIAHERMKAFAYITLFDCFAKLGVAFAIMADMQVDRLVAYAVLLFIIQAINQLFYWQYCIRNFQETRYRPYFNRKSTTQMFSFISWSAYGSLASVFFNHGLNILLNIFFGPVVNAARGVAVQVQNAVTSFNANFHTAFNPQLIKTMARQEYSRVRQLLFTSSKISFFLLCIIGLPIIAEPNYVLEIWLGEVPSYAVSFVQLMLVISIWQSLANSLRVINQAEGNIKKFQLSECTYLMTIVPLAYLCLKLGFPPESVFVVHLFIELTANIIRIKIVLPKIDVTTWYYFRHIYLRILPAFLIPLLLAGFVRANMAEGLARFAVSFITIEIALFLLVYYIGMESVEKKYFNNGIKGVLRKLGWSF